MRIDWAIVCDQVDLADGLPTIHHAGINTLTLQQLPGKTEVILAVQLVGRVGEPPVTITLEIVGPDMAVLSGNKLSNFTFTGPEHPNHPPGWESNAFVPVKVQIDAQQAGTYLVNVGIEGGETKTLPIMVLEDPGSS